jgi:signal transduction histidine kinase
VLGLADQIGDLNARQLKAGNRQVADLFLRFRHTLIGLLVGTLVLGSLLAGGSIYRVLHLERLSEERLAQAVQARTELRELSARLLEVQESERRAISRELHDEIGQQVSALLLAVGNVAAILSAATVNEAKQQLQDIKRVAERTVAVVRDMSLLLRPSMLDDLGLIPALEWQAREVSRNSGMRVIINAADVPDDLADEQRTCIYRVVQEALRNVTRHAKAKSVEVTLRHNVESLQLTIQDDGQGFTPERQKGVGLLGIQERVLRLNGKLSVRSEPGAGTTLIVDMPVLRQAPVLGQA